MAQLSSFATTASNVSTDAATRTITISTEVVEIDGVLDPPTGYSDWGGWTIRCQSNGGFRSTSGASGTLGGGSSSLRIIEATNAHRFGGDNFSNNNGANARFAGDATNVLKYHNIVWIVESGGRSDFDIGRGTSSDGSAGCKVELSGVALYQQHASGGSGHFNHYSGQASIRIHDDVGYGLRIENRTNGPAIEFSTIIHTGSVVEGLVIANVTAANNNDGSRAAVRLENVANNGTMTLSNLNTPSIANVNAPNGQESRDATKTLLLIDPVGLPSRNDWSSRYHGNFEIRRNVPFAFTSADPDGATMHAIAQTSGGQDATSAMSGASDTILVRTHYSPHQDTSSSTWTAYNTYRFFMTGLGFRKYSLTTTQTISNTPATITAALTADVLPDGNAISSITAPTNNNPPDTLSEVLRAIKDIEVANPVTTGYPTTSLAYVDGNAIVINTSYSLDLNSGNSALIYVENDPTALGGLHIDLKTATTLGDSNGLTTIDASGTGKVITTYSVTEDDDVFLKDSTGQKSVINATNNMGATTRFALVNTTNGTTLASSSIANGSNANLVVSTKGLTTGYRLVSKRPGYNYYTADVDLTGGGLKEFVASSQNQIVQPDGSSSYVSSVAVPDTLTIDVTNSGTTPSSRVECGNATFSARQIFKAWEDEIATADGDKYMGLGGEQITYTVSSLKGNEIVLGTHTKVKRKATTDVNATIRATLYAPDDAPVDGANGDVQTIEGLDIPAVASEIWSTDLSGTQTDNTAADLLKDASTNSGGGTTLTAQQVWEYSDRALTTTGGTTPEDVWAYRSDVQQYPATGVSAGGDIILSSNTIANRFAAQAYGTKVRIDATGGYGGIEVGDEFFTRAAGTGVQLFTDNQSALAGTQNARTTLTGTGTATDIRITLLNTDVLYQLRDIPSGVWNVGSRTITQTIPAANVIASQVWSANGRSLTSFTGIGGEVWSSSDALTASDIWSNSTRTLTAGVPTAAENAEAVWGTDIQIVSNTSTTFSPQGVGGSFLILNSAEDTAGMSNGDPIGIDDDGGFTNLVEGTTYYARPNGTLLQLYADRDDAINGTGSAIFPAGGVPSSLVLSVTRRAVTRNLGDASDVLKDILLDTEAVISPPTAMAISDEVWSKVIDGSITGELIVDAESEAGDGFVIPNDDAALIANGDPFTFTNVGNYTNLALNTTYYAFIGNGQNETKVLYVYTSRNDSLTPGAAWVRPDGSDASSVRMVFPENRPIGTAGVAMHRILAAIEELDQDHDMHSAATEAIGVLMNRLLGTGFVESGLSLQQALQIITAVLAGRLEVNQNGTQFTFHRLNTAEDAVIRADASDTGRSTPERDPT